MILAAGTFVAGNFVAGNFAAGNFVIGALSPGYRSDATIPQSFVQCNVLVRRRSIAYAVAGTENLY